MLTPLLALLFGQDMLDWLTDHWHMLRHRWVRLSRQLRSRLMETEWLPIFGEQPPGPMPTLAFTVLLTAQPQGGFAAAVPALPEVVTEGDTPQETLAMAEEAIRALLAYRSDMGIPVPQDTLPLVCRVIIEA